MPGSLCGVALGRDRELLGVEPIGPQSRHDDALLPAIDRLTRRLDFAPRDIARIAVSVGPGGFTGLRIAVAAAKLIALANNAKCIAVPTAHVVAARVEPNGAPFAVALNAKNESAYVASFDAAGGFLAGAPVDAAALASLGIRRLFADRFLPESFRVEGARLGITIHPPIFDPAACLACSFAFPELDPVDLLPLYAREPEAVTKWRELHGGRS